MRALKHILQGGRHVARQRSSTSRCATQVAARRDTRPRRQAMQALLAQPRWQRREMQLAENHACCANMPPHPMHPGTQKNHTPAQRSCPTRAWPPARSTSVQPAHAPPSSAARAAAHAALGGCCRCCRPGCLCLPPAAADTVAGSMWQAAKPHAAARYQLQPASHMLIHAAVPSPNASSSPHLVVRHAGVLKRAVQRGVATLAQRACHLVVRAGQQVLRKGRDKGG